ncbi:H-NS family nucleoid-associated regulatory protein [Paraburkholderia kururiensis]|uniref:H-NS histone family protein n=1 Tax=Paraburkholderia kururiensis TaxID=984307 RepID=UPI000F89A313|nr:H-NS histone family protein [Paraburkholderia kururiensis]
MTKTYRELLAELRELDARIAAEREVLRNGALATIRGLMTEFRITPEDLMTPRGRGMEGSPPVKYRDPLSGATWSGRGRAPAWIAGRDRAAFEI